MNWGYKIILSFIAYAAIIFTMVFISINQDINLVADDYYKQEIAYEDQITRMKNSQSLENLPQIKIDRELAQVSVNFPVDLTRSVEEGSIHLFRPSDAAQDFVVGLSLNNDGYQYISLVNKSRGLWKVKLSWTGGGGKEYYNEKVLIY